MIFRNARLIFSDGIREGLEIVTQQGKIAEIRQQTNAPANGIANLDGNYLAPGFVDLHVHGAVGRDTMEASEEAFRAICDFHASGGTTSLLLTTATAPLDAIVDVIKAVRNCRSSIKQIAGVHVEGPFISKIRRGAQPAEFIQNPLPASVQRLLEHADVIKRITIAPELRGALEAIEKFHAQEMSVSGGHSDASDDEARAALTQGMCSVTHIFNCMSSARRRGVYRLGGLLELPLSEPTVLCELFGAGFIVSARWLKLFYGEKRVLGIFLVTDATAGAGLPDGSRFSLFGNDCIVEGGVCLLSDRSALAGSAARMIDLVQTMVNEVELPLHEALAMATENPARAIGLERKGRLRVGADADLVVLSPELEILRVFTGGDQLSSDRQ